MGEEEEEGDFLDKQRAVMRGSPLPLPLPPRLARGRRGLQPDRALQPSRRGLPSFLRSQPAYNNDSGGGNNGLCDVTTDGRTEERAEDALLSLSPVHELISLSRFQV